MGVSIGRIDGAREGAPPAVGGELVEPLEGVDVFVKRDSVAVGKARSGK